VSRWTREANATAIIDLVATGQLSLRELVTHRFQPSEAAEAYSKIRSDRDRVLGAIFEWSE
jgi:threonine dehydrogenase-like Zn-dependent dehydrogenase